MKRQEEESYNFRSHYYEKVGFRGVEERKTVDILLADDPVNIVQCSTFALKCSVPTDKRLQLWKAILGISSRFQKNRDYVEKWRQNSFESVLNGLRILKRIEANDPKAQVLTYAYVLFSTTGYIDLNLVMKKVQYQNFMAITESVGRIFENEVDVFYMSKELTDLLHSHKEEVFKDLIQTFHQKLSNSSGSLYLHLEKIGLTQDGLLNKWYHRAFAGVLHESALEKIWDKVIGGSMMILVYVALALVEKTKVALLGCQTSKEAISCLISTSEETDDIIAQYAIELWTQEGMRLVTSCDKRLRNPSGSTNLYSDMAGEGIKMHSSNNNNYSVINLVSKIKVSDKEDE